MANFLQKTHFQFMPGALPLSIHRGHTTLKHRLHANSWPLGNKYCLIKQHTPVRCDCLSFTWFPVRAMFPTDAELKADPAWNPLPIRHLAPCPRLVSPSTRRAAQACFLSLAKLQSQIPSLCSGFPLDLTRGLSTKHRLLIICLKIPLRSTGKYDHPSVVNTTAVCCRGGVHVLQVVRKLESELGGRWDVFTLLEKQPPPCQNPKLRSGPPWGALSLGFTLETICSLHEDWLPREILASQSPGLMSGEFHTQASHDLAGISRREDFANLGLCMCLSFGPSVIQRWN